jgi:hypothetical protein
MQIGSTQTNIAAFMYSAHSWFVGLKLNGLDFNIIFNLF